MKKTYIQPTIDVVVVGVQLPLATSFDINSETVDGKDAMSSSFSGGDDGEDW
mgnify:CR=1 FL=1